ncbi:dnaJ homolog subfamily C member 24 [Betta splendens]|uniref:DnaJ homolog subfamily C member 24 n=1 Tax=Betta splendens TaxID=158456 RepID=A0A6P7MRD8_BETSP|nr:dnaJ homolog subfamily C member 24 [Betta splendens]XP_029009457.1 dnaJ homolog subfamily C member 24 [Betta splendens]
MCDIEDKDLYAVLGASPSNSVQELRRRYQQLALKYHPDRVGHESSAESGIDKFLEVEAAWRILGDQNSRRRYDLQRQAQELKQDWPVDSTVCLEDMTWDQDEHAYVDWCRCGGRFSLSEVDTQSRQQDCEKEEEEEEQHRGLVVGCDTCSLTIYVTRPLEGNMYKLQY